MEKNNNKIWATEKEAAEYYNIKPATLRKHRSVYKHDKGLVYKKIGGSIRYNLDHNDRILAEKENI